MWSAGAWSRRLPPGLAGRAPTSPRNRATLRAAQHEPRAFFNRPASPAGDRIFVPTPNIAEKGESMKAIRMHSKGGPELLVYEDAPKPQPQAGDALVRVSASSITKTELTWSETYTACDGTPRLPTIPGHEFSGVVEEITAGVKDMKVGEAVYALASFCRDGSAAEYIAIRAADLAPKPKTLDHVQAASVPLAALT